MGNLILSKKILSSLIEAGVKNFVLCAGARNAPMVKLVQESGQRTFNFPEERSASFFALGLTLAEAAPVAVIVTSGTAVAECFPAMIEAFYQGLPLVVVSADRPRRFRGSGAPQAIEQKNIFGAYASFFGDLDFANHSDLNIFEKGKILGPIHLNVCLEEPQPEEFP